MKRCLGCMEFFGDEFQICPHCGYIEGTPAEEKIHMEPGTLLHNRYIVGKVLGYGGFGVTYIGWDGKLEQKVAIKEYLPGEFSTRMPGQSTITIFSGDKSEQFRDGLKKFIDEAKRLAKFKNEPGIVKIFDSFEENSTAYIVMEFLDGETLKSYLEREGTLPEDEAIKMLMPVMLSLQTVHAEGILHRDIAPDNIFLTKDGEVKLIDFGASRYATTTHSRSLTVIIKPGYSAEEQYRSRGDQGPYTDVYSLGATLYKMITGKTPPDAMERRAKYENQNKDILISPHTILKKTNSKQKISVDRENAILNSMNVRIEDRTPDIGTFLEELNSDTPVKRKQGKIKRIDLYTWPLWLKIAVPALLSLFVILGVLLITGVINLGKYKTKIVLPDNTVTVPDVEGQSQEDALDLLKAQTLGANITSKEYEYQAPGVVVIQDPIQGTYATMNTEINLIISSGRGAIEAEDGISTVPYVIGATKEKALEDLKTAGLADPIIKEENSDDYAAGVVMAQDPASGTRLEEGSQITITVSKGGASFSVPSVVGKKMDEADAELKTLGLQVTIEQKTDSSVPAGQVISQSVAAGNSAKKGDSITIVVSSGKPTATVPNVVGSSSSSAKATLENAGFKVTINEQYSSSVAKGIVISQSPQANTTQSQGTQITLIVSKGAESSQTPTQSSSQTPVQSNWSDWSDSLPSYVSNSSYSIDQRTVYRSRNLETKTSTNSTMDGWELYDTATGNGDYGPWSAWSQDKATKSNTRDVETQTRYRYRDKETTTSTSPSLSGWTLETTSASSGDYGSWSDWSTNSVSSSGSREVETKTQYRYRDKEYKNGVADSYLSGWTQTNSHAEYGSWSGDQSTTSRPAESDTLRIVNQYESAYNYFHYCCNWYDNSWCVDSIPYGNKNSTKYHTIQTQFRLPAVSIGDMGGKQACGGTGSGAPACAQNFYVWFLDSVVYTYVYQTRSVTTLYDYERWGDWSGWSDNSYSNSSGREVETRTLYRYRDKEQTTTYHYYRWKDWSAWSTNAATESASRQVESATFYRYRDRVTQTTYYFRRWSAWSEYTTTPITMSDTRQVQTKTQYRYKSK